MQAIGNILTFITEIEKLKDIQRKSRPIGLKRYENSAEHSWHVALSALVLKDYANEPVNIERVIKMMLIHDLGEIEAGDTIIYSSETAELKSKEKTCIAKLFTNIQPDLKDELLVLWEEFETGKSADAKFAKAIDRLPPLLHNIHDEGHGWKKHGITKEQVFALNSARIGAGSEKLWSAVEQKLNKAVEDGFLS
ncbi:phosphohydrolase [Veronia nyctiphanis]|uniref:Phosphohydrolase n=1 Tax=Veronia nyctiphanis TaxID=1278244 RepID=A0A4Q0YMM4_9GAMM|nr:HD domain-containing protein [Veronia nyctiphanis]RXJ72132.1 phosphohydrolase [Veronia nyctiphanis]